MSAAVEGLATAAARLGEAHDAALEAARALDGISDSLFDGVRDVIVRMDEVRSSAVRARDTLDRAGA
jgi:hypothetical protein